MHIFNVLCMRNLSLAQVQGQMVGADMTSQNAATYYRYRTEIELYFEQGQEFCHIFVDPFVCVPAKWKEWSIAGAKENEQDCRRKPAPPPPPVRQWSDHLDAVILMLSRTNEEVWCGNCRPCKWSVRDKMKSRRSAKDSWIDWCYQPSNKQGHTLFKMFCNGTGK